MKFSNKKFILNEHIYNIRQASTNDINNIIELQDKIYNNSNGWFICTYYQEMQKDNNLSLNVYDNETLIGFISFNVINNTCHILNIMVDPGYRNQGIAKHMLDIVINLSKQQAIEIAKLNVRSDNNIAHNLYNNYGFKDFQKVQNMYGTGQDGIIMKKTL